MLGDEDALGEAHVRELQRRDQVADGVDARDVGAAELVDDDEAAVDGHAGLLVAQALRDRAAADGDEQEVGLDLDAVSRATPGRRSRWARRRENRTPSWVAMPRLR